MEGILSGELSGDESGEVGGVCFLGGGGGDGGLPLVSEEGILVTDPNISETVVLPVDDEESVG